MSDIKFDVKNLNLHYGKFHALKDVNMEIPEKKKLLHLSVLPDAVNQHS